MIKKIAALFLTLPFLLALTVTDTVTPGRVVNGNLVSDADPEPDVPIFGDIQNSGSGNVTLSWAPVTTDEDGNPVTILLYELRYRVVGAEFYELVTVPGNFVGHSLTLSTGSYEFKVNSIDSNGVISTSANSTFTVP